MILLTDEEISGVLRDCDISMASLRHNLAEPDEHKEITKAQLKKVYGWGDEDCPHSQERYLRPVKRQCSKCWQALLEEVKE